MEEKCLLREKEKKLPPSDATCLPTEFAGTKTSASYPFIARKIGKAFL